MEKSHRLCSWDPSNFGVAN